MPNYQDQVASQIAQYENCTNIHDLPPVYHYWSAKYLQPRFEQVLGTSDVADFYATHIAEAVRASGHTDVLSLGSGDCSVEIEVARRLRERKLRAQLHCLELSPLLLSRARAAIGAAGLSDMFELEQADLNRWRAGRAYGAVMAHHALHHVLELEHLFDQVKGAIRDGGSFISCDMIGRNGHMRWPEALDIVSELWERLPSSYRYNRQLRRHEQTFDNFDCSKEGFEGIRAQDILPSLLQRFHFSHFLGYGNLADVFVERSFGPNFSADRPQDRQFIDFVQQANDRLIDEGRLKPTMMGAVMRVAPAGHRKIWRHWTPDFCLRPPRAVHAPMRPEELRLCLADCPAFPREVRPLSPGLNRFTFGQSGNGVALLKDGWSSPEAGHCWSIARAASLELPLPPGGRPDLVIAVNAAPYLSPHRPSQRVELVVNGEPLGQRQFRLGDPPGEPLSVIVPSALLASSPDLRISLSVTAPRDPELEGGDSRTLACCLRNVVVCVASVGEDRGRPRR